MDADIIEQARRGDPGAWERIVTSYTRRIYNLCYRFLGRIDQAEDMTQEIFLKVFRNLDSYRPESGQFITWILSVGRNLLVDHYRQTKDDRVTISVQGDENSSILDAIPAIQSCPQTELEREERTQLLKKALKYLAPQLKEAVIFRDLEELTYEEISQILKIPEGTVKSRINRGRIELAKHVQRLRIRSRGYSATAD